MKKGEKQTPEVIAAMKKGREEFWERKRAEKALTVAKVDAGTAAVAVPVTANGHGNLLDITDPLKWQMKIRLHLESLNALDAEYWMEGYRLVLQMAGVVVRDAVYRRVTNRCYVCDKPFTDGKPAGEAGYFDQDRQYIKVYCCANAHYGPMLEKCMEKESAIRAAVERADKAARQAASDVRSAMRKSIPA